MAKKLTTYVVFDGDNDIWAYRFMKGWKAIDTIEFDFQNAHDIGSLTSNAENETYVKRELKKRFAETDQVVVLVGEKTKNLFKFVRWEIDTALELGLPIIVVNLNGSRIIDTNLCPPILRGKNAIHISFNLAIVKFAMENFIAQYKRIDKTVVDNYSYSEQQYKALGL